MAWMFLPILVSFFARAIAESPTVMVFGDSYGDTGPTYKQVQKMFKDHHIPATVRSAAVGGTSACYWANQDGGNAIVQKTRKNFPGLHDGPNFLWYTAGANDVWQSLEFQACERLQKTWNGVRGCMKSLVSRVAACSTKMLDAFVEAYPKTKIMHSGYDVPCYSAGCYDSFTGVFALSFCAKNTTCNNQGMYDFIDMYHTTIKQRYSEPQYTTLFMMGAVQKAKGVPGADVGKPVLTEGANCAWETDCVHPTYDTPAGNAWGQGFWDLYFSKHVNANATANNVVV
jgi:hypothetical protein